MTTSTSSTSASTPEQQAAAGRLARVQGATFGVPDVAATAWWFREGLGFALEERGDETLVICEGDYGPDGQVAVRLVERPQLELVRLTFDASEGYDFDALRERVEAAGATAAENAAGGLDFHDPSGIPLAVVPAGTDAVPTPPRNTLRPRRLGHVNLKATAPPVAAAYYQDVLGFRLSEQIGDGLFFLRIVTEHHNLGLRPGERGEVHHLGFEVTGWHVYEPILDHLSALDLRVEYGPGRHTPGNNLFTYLCDPSSGLRVELFADMGHIAEGSGHEPKRWEAGDRMTKTLNRWGPTPPESFLA
jgi:2,3-dihydroxy-p-cumate/2,3-dihydroxybenzoate 3,4-dioxygenase